MTTIRLIFSAILLFLFENSFSQKDPATTEVWKPEVKVVTPGKANTDAPSDAIILFNGTSASGWQHANGDEAKWTVADNALTVKPGTGGIQTKQKFGDCQLHIEWRIDKNVKGEGQDRGNSGIFLMGRYELQVLDNYNNINKTYVNGQAGSMYKQAPPLVNVCKAPGEWQTYDIVFTAPRFSDNGSVISPARITVTQNGVLVQNNTTLWGNTVYIGSPTYEKHAAKESLMLQDHSHLTSFRNIWIREL
jgi:3-keto-disaccharide hydrolase